MQNLVTPKGYPLEEHRTLTSDGYVLNLYRIPGSRSMGGSSASPQSSGTTFRHYKKATPQMGPGFAKLGARLIQELPSNSLHSIDSTGLQFFNSGSGYKGQKASDRPAVLLMHGLLDSSATWVNNDPDKSLAFILADCGYDVWLGNARGSTWGRAHVAHGPSSPEFWDFSFDEIALRDIPSIVDHVLTATCSDTLAYIGHSQGCTVLLAALAKLPYLNRRIHRAGLLAPAVFATHVDTPLIRVPAASAPTLLDAAGGLGLRELLPSSHVYPQIYTAAPQLCAQVVQALCGFDLDNLDLRKMPGFVRHTPAGTSARNLAHWAQRVNARRPDTFCMYDFGDSNLRRYGSTEPPEYELANVDVPLSVYSGGVDTLATPRDVALLLEALPGSTVAASKQIPRYGHLDFLWGEKTNAVYRELAAFLGGGVQESGIGADHTGRDVGETHEGLIKPYGAG